MSVFGSPNDFSLSAIRANVEVPLSNVGTHHIALQPADLISAKCGTDPEQRDDESQGCGNYRSDVEQAPPQDRNLNAPSREDDPNAMSQK
jgi:hypothetical protein